MTPKKLYGVISDTHGSLSAAAFKALSGVHRIYHCGDVGARHVITELETIAPTMAVSGNMDSWPLVSIFPDQMVDTAEFGVVCLSHGAHFGHDNRAIVKGLGEQFQADRPRLVLFGHTHTPIEMERDGVLFVNPGSASLPRRGQPCTVALIENDLDAQTLTVQIVALDL